MTGFMCMAWPHWLTEVISARHKLKRTLYAYHNADTRFHSHTHTHRQFSPIHLSICTVEWNQSTERAPHDHRGNMQVHIHGAVAETQTMLTATPPGRQRILYAHMNIYIMLYSQRDFNDRLKSTNAIRNKLPYLRNTNHIIIAVILIWINMR